MEQERPAPTAVTRLLRDVILGADRAERMQVSRLLGGASHAIFLVRWTGAPLEGLNAVTVRLNRDGSNRQLAKTQHEGEALAVVGGRLGPRLLWFGADGEWLERPAMCLEFSRARRGCCTTPQRVTSRRSAMPWASFTAASSIPIS